jgi:hypothetical protein
VVVDRLVDDDAHLPVVVALLGEAKAGRRRRPAGLDRRQDRRSRRRHGHRVDAEGGGVRLDRLDLADDDHVAAFHPGFGRKPVDRRRRRRDRAVGTVEDAKAGIAFGPGARLERADVLATHPLAPAHRPDGAVAKPVLGRGAHLGARRLPVDAEDATQGLERAQRLLQLAHQDQGGIRGVVVERRPHPRRVPALHLTIARAKKAVNQGERHADRNAARRPLRAGSADQREGDRRRDQHPRQVADPPGAQFNASAPSGTMSAAWSMAVTTVGAIRLATRQAAMNRETSAAG